MEIVIRDGDHEITVRDKRPVVEPEMLTELLAAIATLDQDASASVVLPFGFTKLADDDDEEAPPAPPETPSDGVRPGKRRSSR